MGLSNKLNRGRQSTVREGIDTKVISYVKAADLGLMEPVYPIRIIGYFIKEGDYGKELTLIVNTGEGVLGVNMPKRYVENFETLTQEEIEGLKSGDTGIIDIRPGVQTPKGKTTMIDFCDLDPDA